MAVPLTKEVLQAAYEYLATTPPFNRWNMPEADDVMFKVSTHPTLCGWHTVKNRKHVLAISSACVGHTATLLATIAHEMVHMHENRSGADRGKGEHSAAFRRWTKQVCDVHGFDEKAF